MDAWGFLKVWDLRGGSQLTQRKFDCAVPTWMTVAAGATPAAPLEIRMMCTGDLMRATLDADVLSDGEELAWPDALKAALEADDDDDQRRLVGDGVVIRSSKGEFVRYDLRTGAVAWRASSAKRRSARRRKNTLGRWIALERKSPSAVLIVDAATGKVTREFAG